MATQAGIRAGRAFVIIDAVDRTSKALLSAERNFMNLANKVQSIGRSLLQSSVLTLAPFALSAKVFADFDDAMRMVEARSNGTAQEMKNLREQAKELGRTTAFTARQIGVLQSKVAQRGFNREQIFKMTEPIMNLARSGGSGDLDQDSELSAELVTGTMRSFKMGADETAKVSDIFTAAINNSNLTLQDLMYAMSNAGPIAEQYALSLEDTTTAIGAMANLNIDAGVAGTGLRNMFLKMSDPKLRDKFNQNLEAMTGSTIEFVDEFGNLNQLPDVMYSIFEAMDGLGTADKGTLIKDLFGLRAITPALGLGSSSEDFAALAGAIKNSSGEAERMRDLMERGLGGAFRFLKSAIEGVAIAVGDTLDGMLVGLIQQGNQVLDNFTSWIDANQKLVATIAIVAAGVFTLGLALLATGTAMKILVSLSFMFINPLWGIVAVIIKLAVGIIGFIGTIGTFLMTLLGMIIPIATALGPIGVVLAILAAHFLIFAAYGETAQGIFKALGDVLSNVFTSFMESVQSVIARFMHLWEVVKTVFGAITDAAWAGDMEMVWKAAQIGMKLLFLELKDLIFDIWDKIVIYMVEKWMKAINAIKNAWYSLQETAIIVGAEMAGQDTAPLKKMFNFTRMMRQANQTGEINDVLDTIGTAQSQSDKKRQDELKAQRDELNLTGDQARLLREMTEELLAAADNEKKVGNEKFQDLVGGAQGVGASGSNSYVDALFQGTAAASRKALDNAANSAKLIEKKAIEQREAIETAIEKGNTLLEQGIASGGVYLA